MQEGVEQLKNRYADMERNYRDIDTALAPHRNVIRSFGHSDAQSISQLFAWFDALSKRPDESFPVLLKSFNYDPRRLVHLMGGAQQQQQAQPQQDQWRQGVEQELLQQRAWMQHQHQQNENAMRLQTEDTLARWAADKPFFNEPGIRRRMGLLLQPDINGNSVVPLKNGQVDLDEAYRLSCLADSNVAAKMDAQRQAAERKAAKEVADRARRSSMSLSPSSPGRGSGSPSNKPTKGKSVRESLIESIESARTG
jgi:hypothetical protein